MCYTTLVLKPQKDFPLIEEYKKIFDITENTIFAYGEDIYTDNLLPPDLMVHENTHLEQQKKYGLDEWVAKYLTDTQFRLQMEVEAYRNQLNSMNDREKRFHVKRECIKNLCSSLYGNIVTSEQARILLK